LSTILPETIYIINKYYNYQEMDQDTHFQQRSTIFVVIPHWSNQKQMFKLMVDKIEIYRK